MLLTIKVLLRYNSYCLIFLWAFSGCDYTTPRGVKTETGYALGTSYMIKYEAPPQPNTELNYEITAVFERINRSMSTYMPESDISRINRGDTTVYVDLHFKEVYTKAKSVWQHTRGMFDPTVGTLVNAWGFGPETTLKERSPEKIDRLLEMTGFEKITLSESGKVRKTHQDVSLDFNALAKGYTIDCIGRLLDQKGIKNYLIELGGELLTKGINVHTMKDWVVAIDNPLQLENKRTFITRIILKNKAMATSGNYRKFAVDTSTGKRYAHIINPKTGYPKETNVLSASVIANTCMEADAYATAFMVMELNATKEFLKQHPGIEAYIISTDEKGMLITYATKGFKQRIHDAKQ